MVLTKTDGTLDILAKKRVESKVRAQARPVIRVDEPLILPMNDIHVPAHESHLQTKEGWVITVVRKDEPDGIAIGDPSETHTPEKVSARVNCPIASKTFAKVGVQLSLAATAASSAKRNWTQFQVALGPHELAFPTSHLSTHSGEGFGIIRWLEGSISKSKS